MVEERWNEFIKINEDDESIRKPIYLLKLYGKNVIEKPETAREKAIQKLLDGISNNIKSVNKLDLYCVCDYAIRLYGITDKSELIEIINNLTLDNLQTIANSNNSFLYKKMRKNIEKISESDVRAFLKPLLDVFENPSISFDNYYKEVENEYKQKILNIYNVMLSEEYEAYELHQDTVQKYIFIYKNGFIIRFIVNDNIHIEYNTCNKTYLKEVRAVINKDLEVFDKYFSRIIFGEYMSDKVLNELKNKEKYVLKSEAVGNIEIVRDEGDGIHYYKVNCGQFKFQGIDFDVYIEDGEEYEDKKIKKSKLNGFEKKIERLCEIQDALMDKFLNSIVESCKSWGEVDKNNNEITFEYVKKHIGNITVAVDLEDVHYRIEAYLHSDRAEEDFLLGEHTLLLNSGENPDEAFFKMMG